MEWFDGPSINSPMIEYGRVMFKSSSGSISLVSDSPQLSEMVSSSRIWLRGSLAIWLSMSCERIRMGKCVVSSCMVNGVCVCVSLVCVLLSCV